jgi:hypothetical protein
VDKSAIRDQGVHMTEYLIAFNGEWVAEFTDDEMAEKSRAVQALRAEMKAAGVYASWGAWTTTRPCSAWMLPAGSPSSPMAPTPRPRSTSEASRS